MLSPLPRAKRAKNPRQAERDIELAAERAAAAARGEPPDSDSFPENDSPPESDSLPEEDSAEPAPPEQESDGPEAANGEVTA